MTDIVYHFTSASELYATLKTNKLHAIASFGTPSDHNINRGKYFYFATTRSKSAGYTLGNVKLVIDGRKLNYRYKGNALDYFGSRKKSARNPSSDFYKTEFEDRLVLDKPEIPNANQYILAIHVYAEIKTEFKDSIVYGNLIRELRESTIMAEKYGIPIYFYRDQKDFLRQDIRKAYTPDFSEFPDKVERPELNHINYELYPLMCLAAFKNESNNEKILKHLTGDEIIKFQEVFKKHLTYQLKFSSYLYSHIRDETILYFGSRVHNLREKSTEIVRFVLTMIVNEMKELGAKNMTEYIDKKMWKGRKNHQWFNNKLADDIVAFMYKEYEELLQEALNYESYVFIDDEEYSNILKVPGVRAEITKILKNFEKEIRDLITKSNDIFRYSYLIENILKKGDVFNRTTDLGGLSDILGKIEDYKYPGKSKDLIEEFLHSIAILTSNESDKLTEKNINEYQESLNE